MNSFNKTSRRRLSIK